MFIQSAKPTWTSLLATLLLAILISVPTHAQTANESRLVGQFSGILELDEADGKVEATLEVERVDGQQYRGELRYEHDGEQTVTLEGVYEDYILSLEGDLPLQFRFIHGRYTALDEQLSYRGHLDSVIAVQPNS